MDNCVNCCRPAPPKVLEKNADPAIYCWATKRVCSSFEAADLRDCMKMTVERYKRDVADLHAVIAELKEEQVLDLAQIHDTEMVVSTLLDVALG